MKILIFSDSHRNTYAMKQTIEMLKNDIEAVVHLGDLFDDIKPIANEYPALTFHCVLGNCDYDRSAPYDTTIELHGKKIFLTHGHRFNVKYDTNRIFYAALERGVDACLFGHTHTPLITDAENILFLNPGSISLPRNGCPSYGILDISTEGKLDASVVGIESVGRVIMYSQSI